MIDPVTAASSPPTAERTAQLRRTASDLEQAFVQEMLRHAGLAEAFAGEGGPESDAFSGFLLEAVSEQVVADGGFGLAERFYERLAANEGASGPPVRL